MTDKVLIEIIETVSDEDSFVAFLMSLAEDRAKAVKIEKNNPSSPYGSGVTGWQNISIEAFLESAASFAIDWKNNPKGLPNNDNPWKRCARIIYAGKHYE